MMKLFIVVSCDKHSDVSVEPFFNKVDAIDAAKKFAKDMSTGNYPIIEEKTDDEWIYHLSYSPESYVFVTEHKMKTK